MYFGTRVAVCSVPVDVLDGNTPHEQVQNLLIKPAESASMNVNTTLTPVQISFDANTIIVVSVLLLVLGFVFFVYLLLRRTAQGFKEGMKQDR
jgi:hypothetical protein